MNSTYHNDCGNVRRDESIHAARCAGQKYVRIHNWRAHRAGSNASQVHKCNAPPMMHQFQRNTQKDLNNQIHHDVHNAHVHKHICNETPCLVATEWIVDEQCGRRSIRTFTNLFVIMWILAAGCIGIEQELMSDEWWTNCLTRILPHTTYRK